VYTPKVRYGSYAVSVKLGVPGPADGWRSLSMRQKARTSGRRWRDLARATALFTIAKVSPGDTQWLKVADQFSNAQA
jgi:hypothetical protein